MNDIKSGFTVGLVQEKSLKTEEESWQAAEAGIRNAHHQGANIIALSELFSRPYFCTSEATGFFEFAESEPWPTVERFRGLARELEVVLVVPFFEKRSAGVYHNSAAVVDADGSILGIYRKMHIPDDPLYYEKYYFTPGDADETGGGFRVFNTRYARVGVLICWDQWFPEAARITALMGAEVLLYPTAIGWHPKEKGEFGRGQVEAWQTIQRSHAIANGLFVAAVNRVGFEQTPGTDGLEFFGSSFVADPFGRVLVSASENAPSVIVSHCERALIEETRRNWPFFRDRRIDSYSALLKRFG